MRFLSVPSLAGALIFFFGFSHVALANQYGRTLQPVTTGGKVLPPGSYVDIVYDGGDVWLTYIGADATRIPKTEVVLVGETDYDPPLDGSAIQETILYKRIPSLARDASRLRQESGQSLPRGTTFKVFSRQGDDYIVGVMLRTTNYFRIPVSAVNVSGSLQSGKPPPPFSPLPAGGLAPIPTAAAPPRPPGHNFVDDIDFGLLALCIAILLVALAVILAPAGLVFRIFANTSTTKSGEADYGIPHAKFRLTSDGFRVSFVRSSQALYKFTHAAGRAQTGGPLAAVTLLLLAIVFLFAILIWYGIESFFRTVITVDPEFVTVGRKRMARRDFGGFLIHHSLSNEAGEVAVLGYNYGRRNFAFGGVWDHGKAQEVASALNHDLRRAPIAGDEHNPSQETLRVARPTDF